MTTPNARRVAGLPPALIRDMTDASPLAVAVTAGAGHVLRYVNPAFIRLAGERAGENGENAGQGRGGSPPLEGLPLKEALPESGQGDVPTALDRVLHSRHAETLSELEHRRVDGRTVYWTWVIWPVLKKEGVTGLMVEILDTTGQVLKQQALERTAGSIRELSERLVVSRIRADELSEELAMAERRFRAFVEAAPDAQVVIQPTGRIALVNACAERMFGYDRLELLDQPLELLVPVGLSEALVAPQTHDEVQGSSLNGDGLELRACHKDGHGFPVEVQVSSFMGEEGRLFILSFRDITGRKRAEEERAALLVAERAARAEAETARRRLSLIAQASTLLVGSFEISSSLPRVARLIVPEMADWCAFDLAEERLSDGREDEKPARPMSVSSLPEELEARAGQARDRLVLWVLKHDRPVIHPSANPPLPLEDLGFGEILSLPLRDHEQIVGALTLLNAQRRPQPPDLIFARELAFRAGISIESARLFQDTVRAVNSRDNLLAVVSHDLRNLLATLMLDSQRLARNLATRQEEPNSRMASRIERTIQQMNSLIQDLVDSTGVATRALRVVPEEQDILPLLHQVLEMMRPAAAARSIALEHALPEEAGPLVVPLDRVRIIQVLTNLLGNALKFTPEQGQVTLGLERRSDGLVVWVKDTGRGIPEPDLPHIFERFWRTAPSNKTGVGLGLFIAKGIVEQHGGRLWVETREGKGSTFYFSLPTGRS